MKDCSKEKFGMKLSDLKIQFKASAQEAEHNSVVFDKLQTIIKEYADYKVFDNYLHIVGNGGRSIDHYELTRHLTKRTNQIGANEAFDEIQSYLDSDQIKIEYALLLQNEHADCDFEFCNGVKLTRVESLTDSVLRDLLIAHRFGTSFGANIPSLLVVNYDHKKSFHRNTEAGPAFFEHEKFSSAVRTLNDTRLLLSCSKSSIYGIPVFAGAFVVPKSLSFLEGGITTNPYAEPQTSFGPELIELEMRHADERISQFGRLSEEHAGRMRTALKRLNDAKIDRDWANKSINLRICLENLFLNPGERDQRRKIQERAPSQTAFSKSRAGKVYGLLSSAAHSGKPWQHSNIDENMIFAEIQKVIRNFISNGGYPMWATQNTTVWRRKAKQLKKFLRASKCETN